MLIEIFKTKVQLNSIILFLVIIVILNVARANEWTEFGGNFNGTHYVPNISNDNYDWTNFNISIGQDQEISVGNFVGDSSMEALIWNNSNYRLFLINLTNSGSIIQQFNINAALLGEPTVFKSKYYAIVKSNIDTNSYFYEIKFSESTYNVTYNFSFGDSSFGVQVGVRCATTNGTDYCIFIDINNTIERVDVTNKTYTKFKNDFLVPFDLRVMKRVPALADIQQDGGLDAIFTYTSNDTRSPVTVQTASIFVYDIPANASNNGFNGNGHAFALDAGTNVLNITPAFVHKYNNQDNRLDITTAAQTNNPELVIFDANGTRLFYRHSSNNRDYTTIPVLSNCNFDGQSRLGVQFFTGEASLFDNSYQMFWIHPNLSSDFSELGPSAGGTNIESFIKQTQSMVAADFNGDGQSELLFSFSRYDNGATTLSIVNCSNSTHILKNLTGIDSNKLRYHNIVVDFDNDGRNDIILTTEGKTLVFRSNLFADLEIVSITPVQVIPDVDMVLGKTGLVRVNVRNNGNINANGTVTITFEGNQLIQWQGDNNTKQINSSLTENFDFSFRPTMAGTQLFSTNVSIS